jgi:hypothetical protein
MALVIAALGVCALTVFTLFRRGAPPEAAAGAF